MRTTKSSSKGGTELRRNSVGYLHSPVRSGAGSMGLTLAESPRYLVTGFKNHEFKSRYNKY